MSYISLRGSSANNPYTAVDYHVLLSHATLPDILVLHAHLAGAEPYVRAKTGWPTATGRNIRGALTVSGSLDLIAEEWQLSFLVSRQQAELFDALLMAQQVAPVTLSDRFNQLTDNAAVWLQVDQQYLTPARMGVWWALQFRALQE
jgi:hypothetical protein